MQMTIDDIVVAMGGRLVRRGDMTSCSGVGTDSRSICSGDLFIALRGVHFDGHNFCAEAFARGARAMVVSRPTDLPEGCAVIEVADTERALGDLAHAWRRRFSVPCVAITGSNGKSTTKEMAAAVAGALGPILSTAGNFNNLVGLPLTLFRWQATHCAAVVEMGMNAVGEIRRLTELAMPDIGLITNITAAHLEKLGTVEAVARAKGELFEAMGGKGTAIINNEDPWVKRLSSNFQGKIIRYGMQNDVDVQFLHVDMNGLDSMELTCRAGKEETTINLPVPGIHNVMNALAAIAIGYVLNIDLATAGKRLTGFKQMPMRFEQVQLANGVRVVNDSYNANPESMQVALRTVGAAKRAGRFIAVLGDMLELGEESDVLHLKIGAAVAARGVDLLMAFGREASYVVEGALVTGFPKTAASAYNDIEVLTERLIGEIRTGDVVLVKGSRGMRMERIVEQLKRSIGCG